MKKESIIAIICVVCFIIGIVLGIITPIFHNDTSIAVCQTYCHTEKAYWLSKENICRCVDILEEDSTLTKTTYNLECNVDD